MIYQITHTKDSKYIFTTDDGIVYTVYFDINSGIFPNDELDKHAIYVGFICTPDKGISNRIYDNRVSETIMYIIANMFGKNKQYIIIYICSDKDNQGKQRSRLFGRWYSNSPLKDKIIYTPKNISNSYFGILYSKKHPNINDIEDYLNSDGFEI